MGDQFPQHALALRQGPHPGVELLIDADCDEVGQAAVCAEDAERPVAGIDQLGRRLGDAVQGAAQVQPRGDGEERVQQVLHPLLAAGDRRQPLLHLGRNFAIAFFSAFVGNMLQKFPLVQVAVFSDLVFFGQGEGRQ